MYHVEITGTVTEGKEREQSDLISRCSQSSPEIAHVPLYLHWRENVLFFFNINTEIYM